MDDIETCKEAAQELNKSFTERELAQKIGQRDAFCSFLNLYILISIPLDPVTIVQAKYANLKVIDATFLHVYALMAIFIVEYQLSCLIH